MSNSANPFPEPRADTSENEPSVDQLFDVLSESRRRRVLSILTEHRSPMDVERLASAVAERESASTARDVHVTLHHVHLPKLDEAALVDFDREDGTVAPTATTDAVPIDIE